MELTVVEDKSQSKPTDRKMEKNTKVDNNEFFEDFYSGVTLHGFRFLFQGHWSRRLVWFVITSGVLMFSIYLFSGLLLKYFEREAKTELKRIYVQQLDFPTITFCPLNTLSKDNFQHLPFNLSKDWSIEDLIKEEPTDETLKLLEFLEYNGVDSLIAFYSVFHIHYEDLITDILYHFCAEDSVCNFYGCPCNSSMFTRRVWENRLCFQFNALQEGEQQLHVKKTFDYFSGLELLFDFKNVKTNTFLNGMILLVTSYGDIDDTKPSNRYITIRPGEYTMLKLTEKRQKLLKEPFPTKCVDDEPFDIIDQSFHHYTVGLCITDCVMKYINDSCGCVDGELNLKLKKEIKVCGLKDLHCYRAYSVHALDPEGDTKKCYDNCHDECSKTKYEISTTSANLVVTDYMHESLKKTEQFKNNSLQQIQTYIRENVAGVQISFFDNSVLLETLTESVSWTTLIATIGGGVGLGFGFSFITIFEFIFFFYDVIKLAFSKRMERSGKYETNKPAL